MPQTTCCSDAIQGHLNILIGFTETPWCGYPTAQYQVADQGNGQWVSAPNTGSGAVPGTPGDTTVECGSAYGMPAMVLDIQGGCVEGTFGAIINACLPNLAASYYDPNFDGRPCGCMDPPPPVNNNLHIIVTSGPWSPIAYQPPYVPTPPCSNLPGCSGQNGTCPATPSAPANSSGPIRYASGEIVLMDADVVVPSFGVPWGHTRTFANRLCISENIGYGFNWRVDEC